jgi:hypothetical protein
MLDYPQWMLDLSAYLGLLDLRLAWYRALRFLEFYVGAAKCHQPPDDLAFISLRMFPTPVVIDHSQDLGTSFMLF